MGFSIRILSLLLFWGSSFLQAAEDANSNSTLLVTEAKKEYTSLKDHLYILADSSHKWTFSEVLKSRDEFVEFNDGMKWERGLSYWGKFQIKNTTQNTLDLTLLLSYADYIDFYYGFDSGDYKIIKAGFLLPHSQHSQPELHPLMVQFTIPSGETAVCYPNFWNEDFGSPEMAVKMWDSKQAKEIYNPERRNLFQGIFQGILWIMIIYNLFFGVINRDRTYYFYAAYMFVISLFFANLFGLLHRYVVTENPVILIYVWMITQTAAIFYIQFVRDFLNLKQLLPKWDKISGFMIISMIVLVIFKAAYLLLAREFGLLGYLSQFLIFMGVILTGGLVIALYRTGNRLARYFILGSLSLGIAMAVSFVIYLIDEGFSQDYFYSLQIGIIAEIAFFSLGLGYKVKMMERERRKAQDELIEQLQENHRMQEEANIELERKVLERTREIEAKKLELEKQNKEIFSQRNVLEKQKLEIENNNRELKELNEEKNHLISIVAHDLRNPLTSAMSLSESLKTDSENLDEDQHQAIKVIHNAMNRMNNMILRILDVRAIESKKLNLEMEVAEVESLVSQVVRRFKDSAGQKDIELICNFNAGYIEVDRNYFIQVMENLLSNAIKFSPYGKNVYISSSKTNDKLCIEVRDEGPGIGPGDMKMLFGKYKKLSARPTGGESSTGIGLSIAKKFVEAMRGKIWCESEPGKGARFLLEFSQVKVMVK